SGETKMNSTVFKTPCTTIARGRGGRAARDRRAGRLEDRAVHLRLAARGPRARFRPHARGVVDLSTIDPPRRRPAVPAIAARLGGDVQPRARLQRRAEDG